MQQDTPIEAERDDFWVAYVSSAYQYLSPEDQDPNSEPGTGGICWCIWNNYAVAKGGDASWVFLETCRDREALGADPGLVARDVAHEIGHQLGLGHWPGTLMNPYLQFIQPNPGFGDQHLHLLRSRVKSPGQ